MPPPLFSKWKLSSFFSLISGVGPLPVTLKVSPVLKASMLLCGVNCDRLRFQPIPKPESRVLSGLKARLNGRSGPQRSLLLISGKLIVAVYCPVRGSTPFCRKLMKLKAWEFAALEAVMFINLSMDK
ncbi:hypothetical protein PS723_06088 [Pseudomonas fluorescens]|uniref:Uncharacterized protein n=1 Tax=Pseudomonas fluorescens TaxID=294 RepID=A0A5E7FUN1_PSEFL|nr:hypothetical protein PS723_06088 [Pseudomonas fluorescens]